MDIQARRTRNNRVTINLASSTAGDLLEALSELVERKPEAQSYLSSYGRHLSHDKAPSGASARLVDFEGGVTLVVEWTDEDEEAFEEACEAERARREAKDKADKLAREHAAKVKASAEADLKVVDDSETV
jgi:hypothetical protein